MARLTSKQEAVKEAVETTKMLVSELDTKLDELMRTIVRYDRNGHLSNGVALGLADFLLDIQKTMGGIRTYSHRSVVKFDEVVSRKSKKAASSAQLHLENEQSDHPSDG